MSDGVEGALAELLALRALERAVREEVSTVRGGISGTPPIATIQACEALDALGAVEDA